MDIPSLKLYVNDSIERKCYICKNEVKSYLYADFYPPCRGNEHNFTLIFCKNCSISNDLWHEDKFKVKIQELESKINERDEIISQISNLTK